MSWISETSKGAVLAVRAAPRASSNAVQGLHGDAVKIRLRAPPVDGRANAALIDYLADMLDIPTRNLALLSGESGRAKRVLITGLPAAAVAERLGLPLPGAEP